jgi:hypothetical protein
LLRSLGWCRSVWSKAERPYASTVLARRQRSPSEHQAPHLREEGRFLEHPYQQLAVAVGHVS